MTTEQITVLGIVINFFGLLMVVSAQYRGRITASAADATNNAAQFTALDKACSASISALRNELLLKVDHQSTNVGNVVQNLGNRIHDVELKAAEARAVAAENMLKMTTELREEFRRDVKEETNELREEMRNSFKRLEAHVDDVSQSLSRGILGLASHPA